MKSNSSSTFMVVLAILLSFSSCQKESIKASDVTSSTTSESSARVGAPRVWILSDLSDPGDPTGTDKDDIVALSATLMRASELDIQGVVVGSTSVNLSRNALSWTNNNIISAYNTDRPGMNAVYPGYQTNVPTYLAGTTETTFSSSNNYSDISAAQFSTVRSMLAAAQSQKLFVLCWGPLTEAAIAVKHCKTTGKTALLSNLVFISHWTSSYLKQNPGGGVFNTYNCNKDAAACSYIHNTAGSDANVKFYELGAIGQLGFVDRPGAYGQLNAFQNSALGRLFKNTKTVSGNPDGSDMSTAWALMGGFGVTYTSFPSNGTLTRTLEDNNANAFNSNYTRLMDDLRNRSNAAN